MAFEQLLLYGLLFGILMTLAVFICMNLKDNAEIGKGLPFIILTIIFIIINTYTFNGIVDKIVSTMPK